MNKKTIMLICYGPVGLDPRNSSPWEDVWIEYEVNRKKISEGPEMICGVDDEIKTMKRKIDYNIKKYGEADDWGLKELNLLLDVKKRFDAGDKYFICGNIEKRLPTIYINCAEMRQKEVEEAIEFYLRQKGVLKSEPRFIWKKNRSKIVAIPV